MVIFQLSPGADTSATNLLFRLIEGLSESTHGVAPSATDLSGFEFGLKALVVLLAALVVAVSVLGGLAVYIFRQWQKSQREGVAALSKNKDTAKREIMGILEKQLSASDAATVAANAKLGNEIESLNKAYNLIRLDLVVLAQKCKVNLMSLPSHKPSNHQDLNENTD